MFCEFLIYLPCVIYPIVPSGLQMLCLFPRAMSQAAVLARTVGECREGQIPRPLGRCKLDTPLLAAGSLIQGTASGAWGITFGSGNAFGLRAPSCAVT